MKFILTFLLLSLASQSFASAPAPEFVKMIGSCRFDQSPTKQLEAVIYGNKAKSGITAAHVTINSINSRGSVVRVLARYEMIYNVREEFSFFIKFATADKKNSLEIFGDDMGGISTFTAGNKSYALSCSLSEQ